MPCQQACWTTSLDLSAPASLAGMWLLQDVSAAPADAVNWKSGCLPASLHFRQECPSTMVMIQDLAICLTAGDFENPSHISCICTRYCDTSLGKDLLRIRLV
mmetsp:Transcript_95965/g.175759  ORF Transcript_95965/g.175759 Transcript_95965/m.175759 type:complete len:102 (+) Transcript_95965:504-809(+)